MAVLARASITLAQTVDITGYYRFYKLQSSTAAVPAKPTSIDTLPPSGWSDTEPSYTEGTTNSLYFVDLTKYSDGTFEYSDVSLASSYEAAKQAYNKSLTAIEAVENMDIGGRNLLHNTNVINLSKAALRPNINGDSASSGHLIGSAGTLVAATHGARITSTSAQRPGFIFGLNDPSASGTHGLAVGKEYTFSCDWETKTLGGSQVATTTYYLRAYLYYATSTSASYMTQHSFATWYTFKKSDTSDRNAVVSGHGSFTFTVPEDAAAWNIRIYSTNIATASIYAAGNYLQIENVKLEEGNVPTAWSPAPEDFDTAIEEAAKVANNYFSTDTLGAMIADMRDGVQTPSTATGRNVLITNEDVQVRDGQASIASFGEGTRVGKKDEVHMEVESGGIIGYNSNDEMVLEIANEGAQALREISIKVDKELVTTGNSVSINLPIDSLPITTGTAFRVLVMDTRRVSRTVGSFVFGTSSEEKLVSLSDGSSGTLSYTHTSTKDTIKLKVTALAEYATGMWIFAVSATMNAKSPTFSFGSNVSEERGAFTASFGEGLETSTNHMFAVGKYNADDGDTVFAVGGGTISTRKNIFAVSENGDTWSDGTSSANFIKSNRILRYTPTWTSGEEGSDWYCLLTAGMCHIMYQGTSKAHAANSTLFTLPTNCRPSVKTEAPFVKENKAYGFVTIDTDGVCTVKAISSTSATGRIYINCTFPVALPYAAS